MPDSLNVANSDPSLKDVLDLMKKDILLSMNCHALATVRSVNYANQTLTATINYSKTRLVGKPDGSRVVQAEAYPVLIDCPFYVMQGGKGFVSFPIAVGDTCSILFNDRDINNWFATGVTNQPPESQRLHAFADGIALVGLRSGIRPILNYDEDRAVLGYDVSSTLRTVVALKDKIELNNTPSPTTSLGFILKTMLTAMAAATTASQIAAAAAAAEPQIEALLK